MKKKEKIHAVAYKESVAHFVTVIGSYADEQKPPANGFTEESFKQAIAYTLEFIKYRFDPKNITCPPSNK